jgi:hypothetical protein
MWSRNLGNYRTNVNERKYNEKSHPGLVVHICNHSTRRWRPQSLEFQVSLGYIVRTCLKKTNQRKEGRERGMKGGRKRGRERGRKEGKEEGRKEERNGKGGRQKKRSKAKKRTKRAKEKEELLQSLNKTQVLLHLDTLHRNGFQVSLRC